MASFKSFLSFLLPLLLSPSFSISKPQKNITLGSSLAANSNTKTESHWSSPSGDFAFGFLQIKNNGFLLAIWFNKIPQKTVVWSANRNHLLPNGSTLELTTTGHLVLNNSSSARQVWSPNLGDPNNTTLASYASLLDNGNFVLAAKNSQILWQTFDEPTDTILPSQSMNTKALISSDSATDYSEGRFQLWMQSDGNLVLYSRIVPLGAMGDSYWESGTVGYGFELVFTLFGSVFISAKNGTILQSLFTFSNVDFFYQRAVLDYDGVFRLYVYGKSDGGLSWRSVSNSIPSNICWRINDGLGSGVCGYNSYCEIGKNERPICKCPQGYVRIDPNDGMKGCKRSFVPQRCDGSVSEVNAFDYFNMNNSDWPSSDYEAYSGKDERWCRRACLDDCFCAAVVFERGNCWKKKFPLSFGRVDGDFKGNALIKFRKDDSTFIPTNLVNIDSDKTLKLIGLALLGCSGFLFFIFLLAASRIAYCISIKKSNVRVEKLPVLLGMNLRSFSYEELNKATSGFTEKLGSGAFATVYKGVVDNDDDDNNTVAVKKLDTAVKEGDQEFKAEVSAIARTNHKNLVRLLGFCDEEPHKMLVYEFMRNGSLAEFLFGTSRQNWYKRIQLAIGTARGLCYLHEECKTQIIHCDIKPQNILLDDSFGARIADFGLAKLLKKDQTRTMTAIRGTKGYVAPEWFRNLPITVKVDVYSFGIMLLEIICCRRSFELEVKDENEMVLADWAYDCLKKGRVEMLVSKDEEAKNDMRTVEKMVMIGIWCIQEEPSLRPSMNKVLQMLEGVVQVSTPPHPSSFISKI